MFSKLNNLLRRNPRQPLTEKEAQEIVHELIRPILEPIENPQPGFVSSRHFDATDVVARVRSTSWFTKCGGPLTVNFSTPVRRVTSWADAMALCRTDQWHDTELEAQNQLSVWLHLNAREDFQRWNDYVRGFDETLIKPVVEPAIIVLCRERGLDQTVMHCVCWDMLGALIENHYLYTGHRAFFFLELLELYEAGHFPCGWAGEWPHGDLYVF